MCWLLVSLHSHKQNDVKDRSYPRRTATYSLPSKWHGRGGEVARRRLSKEAAKEGIASPQCMEAWSW